MNELYDDKGRIDLEALLREIEARESREKAPEFINNVFDFDTTERAQDAFLCWCANWANCDASELGVMDQNDAAKLRALGREFVGLLLGKRPGEIGKVDIKSQLYVKWQDLNENQKKNHRGYIDILMVAGDTAAIIEDKVESTIHNDQLNGYEKAIRSIIDNGQFVNDYKVLEKVNNIRKVYVKTDYFFDSDNKVKGYATWADAKMLLKFLASEKFRDIDNDLFKYFLLKLCVRIREIDRVTQLNGDPNTVVELLRSRLIAQHHLMRTLFGYGFKTDRPRFSTEDENGKNDEGEDDREAVKDMSLVDVVYQGTSKGRIPWTEYRVYGRKEGRKEEMAASPDFISWRIDSDKEGPYLSLKLWNDKTDTRHRNLCENLFYVLNCAMGCFSGDIQRYLEIGLGHKLKIGYSACDLIHLHLRDAFTDRNEIDPALIGFTHDVTDFILEVFKIEDGLLGSADPMKDQESMRDIARRAAVASRVA